MRLRNKVVSLSFMLAVSGMLAMGNGTKAYAAESDSTNEAVATSTDAISAEDTVDAEEAEGTVDAEETAGELSVLKEEPAQSEVTDTVETAGAVEVTEKIEASSENSDTAETLEGITDLKSENAEGENIEEKGDMLLLEEEDAPAVNYLTVYNGVDYSLVYDYEYYIKKYPDVKRAFNGDEEATLKHFVTCGMKEGRQGNQSFELSSYRNAYADLRREYGANNDYYYKHYVTYGVNEHRVTSGVTQVVNPISVLQGRDYSGVYNFDYYVGHYSDIKRLFGNNDIAALQHFINNGMAEKRKANESFDVDSYYLSYQDLRVAYNKNWKQYYDHYVKYGEKEHRKTSGETVLQNPVTKYKTVDYRSVYDYYYYYGNQSDLRRIYGQDDIALLNHFVHYGIIEGRQAKASYNKTNYNNLKKKSSEIIAKEKAEEEARRKAEEARKRAEEEARRKAEEEKKRAEELAKRRAADPAAAAVLDRVGWTLPAAYNYASSEIEYYGKLVFTESWGSYNLAQQGFNNKTGNCYVMAAVFYEMAKMLGYDVHQIAGGIPLIGGGECPHSWCEVVLDGKAYVCDPDLTKERGNDAYMKPYGSKGIWKYQNYHRMN